jgi:hypothetical protein
MDTPALLIIAQQSLQQLQRRCNIGTSAAERRHGYSFFTCNSLLIIVQQSLQQLQQRCNIGTSAAVRLSIELQQSLQLACMPAYVCIRQHTSAYVSIRIRGVRHGRSGEALGLSLLRILLRILPRIH